MNGMQSAVTAGVTADGADLRRRFMLGLLSSRLSFRQVVLKKKFAPWVTGAFVMGVSVAGVSRLSSAGLVRVGFGLSVTLWPVFSGTRSRYCYVTNSVVTEAALRMGV